MAQKEKSNRVFWWNLINTMVAIAALYLAIITFHQQKVLNKQYLLPNLSLIVYGSDIGSAIIQIRNINIIPAEEIYVKKNIYYCSQDGRIIYADSTVMDRINA